MLEPARIPCSLSLRFDDDYKFSSRCTDFSYGTSSVPLPWTLSGGLTTSDPENSDVERSSISREVVPVYGHFHAFSGNALLRSAYIIGNDESRLGCKDRQEG